MSQLYSTKNLLIWFNIGEDMMVFINTKKANLGTKNFSSQPNGKWFNSRKIKNYKNLSRPFCSKFTSHIYEKCRPKSDGKVTKFCFLIHFFYIFAGLLQCRSKFLVPKFAFLVFMKTIITSPILNQITRFFVEHNCDIVFCISISKLCLLINVSCKLL